MNFEADRNNETSEEIPPQVFMDFAEFAYAVSASYEKIIAVLEPQVLRVIETNNTDVAVIENLLDQLLDVCDDERSLRLYRVLCRHYWTISQTNTVFYVNAYRRMWDNGGNSQ